MTYSSVYPLSSKHKAKTKADLTQDGVSLVLWEIPQTEADTYLSHASPHGFSDLCQFSEP